jgi:glycosyltransferase involved in cell wall biosynthesis
MATVEKVLTLWSARYGHGGAVRRIIELADGLSRRGTEVILLSAHDYPGSDKVQVVPVSLPHHRFRTIRMALSHRLISQVGKQLDKYNPDVVFCFGLDNGGLLCPAAKKRKIPVILFIRAVTLTLQNNLNIPLHNVPAIGALTRTIYAGVFRAFSRKILRQTDAIVFQHQQQHQSFQKERMIDSAYQGKIFFLPNNSNPSWLTQQKPYQSQKEPVAVIAANLFWNKGFRVVLDAFRKVKNNFRDAQLIILGDGPQENAIRQYANDLEGVELKGRVDNVSDYLASARLLIYASLIECGSPNIVLEGSAIGMPMLVSDEAIHTVSDYPGVYQKHDSDKLTQLWIKVLNDDAFHKKLCTESAALGERFRFNWVGKVEEILRLVGESA